MAITEKKMVECLLTLAFLFHALVMPASAWALDDEVGGMETSVYVMPYLPGSEGDTDSGADSEDPAAPGAPGSPAAPGASDSPDASPAPDAGNIVKTANVAPRGTGHAGSTAGGPTDALPRTGDRTVMGAFLAGLAGIAAAIGVTASLRIRANDRRDEGRKA